MAAKKVAITVPEDVLKKVDKIAKKLNLSRSSYITRLLKNVSHELEKSERTQKINEAFSDEALQAEQKKVSDLFLELEDESGQEW